MNTPLSWVAIAVLAVGVVLTLANRGVGPATDARARRELAGMLVVAIAVVLLDMAMWLAPEGWFPGKVISTAVGVGMLAAMVAGVRVFVKRVRETAAEDHTAQPRSE